MILLDSFLPRYDVSELHSIAIDAPPEAVMDAARRVTLGDLPLSRLLIAIRGLRAGRADVPLIDGFQRRGFMLLGERQDELVLGVLGRFWHPRDNVRPSRAEEFVPFAEPGFAKGAINFRVATEGERTVFSTETRVLATDAAARRRFRAYWLLVRPGSGAIRRDLLRAVRAASVRSTSATVV